MASQQNYERKWLSPNRRAAGYAAERKSGVHQYGKKKDEPLTDYDKGVRSGYLLRGSDEAGLHIYKDALNHGLSKAEAKQLSKIKNKEKREAYKNAKKRK